MFNCLILFFVPYYTNTDTNLIFAYHKFFSSFFFKNT